MTQATLAVVGAFLGLSRESVYFVRKALKKYVTEQMQPEEYVALVKTSTGLGSLGSFTNNKEFLYSVIDKITFNPYGRGALPGIEQVGADIAKERNPGKGKRDITSPELEALQQDIYAIGTLEALYSITAALKPLAGKKAVILLSDGFDATLLNSKERYEKLVTLANASSVVFYSIDTRGIAVLDETAADRLSVSDTGFSRRTFSSIRPTIFNNTQQGLANLAADTGGFIIRSTNDIAGGVGRVMNDLRHYYLLAYSPETELEESEFTKQTYRKITVKVKKPNLQLKYRKGYSPSKDEGISPLLFNTSEAKLKLHTSFSQKDGSGSIAAIMLIDPESIFFSQETEDRVSANIGVALEILSDASQVIEQTVRNITISFSQQQYEQAKKQAFVFPLEIPASKPGYYHVKASVKDLITGKTGATSQFLQIPDLKKGALSMSGLNISSSEPMSSLHRKFKNSDELDLQYEVYNPKTDEQKHIKLTTQMFLYCDGELIHTAAEEKLSLETVKQILPLSKKLKFGKALLPGNYLVQIVVKDEVAKKSVSQSLDIEIAKPE
ncbi:MAG: VWA domain-containing protein [Blastocatellia bacterium]|nr:VWA domain-containing protein [Blastocatellia bacterium]